MIELIRNKRILGAAVAVIGVAVAAGAYNPTEAESTALVAVVTGIGGAVVAALTALAVSKFGGKPPAIK